ncbi:helix-turn-helix transcriptional regulator [Nocardia speluncae]|uniref:helix-turn-helix transcriptional regulator n=1 Tax=Nocardia speluncae TaxID=419477 RepID=UPI0024805533|nr:helix-turn-helix transcriptional regulator [Nocardia speluncae]
MGKAIRGGRERRRMTAEDLAVLVGVTKRQIGRWENGEQAPSLARSVQLAHALQVPIAEIAGESPGGIDLSGDWCAAWQSQKDGVGRVDVHALTIGQQGEILSLNGSLARPVGEGSVQWLGELRLWDNEALMGWYRTADGAVRSKGTIYFALHPHGQMAWGTWAGQSCEGLVIRGWGAIARDRDEVERVVHGLIETDGSWSP